MLRECPKTPIFNELLAEFYARQAKTGPRFTRAALATRVPEPEEEAPDGQESAEEPPADEPPATAARTRTDLPVIPDGFGTDTAPMLVS